MRRDFPAALKAGLIAAMTPPCARMPGDDQSRHAVLSLQLSYIFNKPFGVQ
jgi:hypothetical protein